MTTKIKEMIEKSKNVKHDLYETFYQLLYKHPDDLIVNYSTEDKEFETYLINTFFTDEFVRNYEQDQNIKLTAFKEELGKGNLYSEHNTDILNDFHFEAEEMMIHMISGNHEYVEKIMEYVKQHYHSEQGKVYLFSEEIQNKEDKAIHHILLKGMLKDDYIRQNFEEGLKDNLENAFNFNYKDELKNNIDFSISVNKTEKTLRV